MKAFKKLFPAFLLGLLFVSQLNAQVKSDFDKSLDFTKFKTYTFKGWEKNSDQQLNDFDKKRILESFQSELIARGMTKDDNSPDVGITLYIVIDDKTSTTAYTSFNGGMGYGMGRFGGWGYGGMGMGSATTSYSEDDYKQGTVVIDFYDESTNKLAWQGVLTTVVKEKPKQREKSIPKNISKLMGQYPIKPIKE